MTPELERACTHTGNCRVFITCLQFLRQLVQQLGVSLALAEACNKVAPSWAPGEANPANTLTKEGHITDHCAPLRDLMVAPREECHPMACPTKCGGLPAQAPLRGSTRGTGVLRAHLLADSPVGFSTMTACLSERPALATPQLNLSNKRQPGCLPGWS